MPVPMSPKNGNKNNKGFNWGRFSKTLSFWVFILLIPVVLIQLAGPRSEATTEINYTDYRTQLAKDNIKDVTVSAGKNITGTFRQAPDIGSSMLYDIGCYAVSLLFDLGLPPDALVLDEVERPGGAEELFRLSGRIAGLDVRIRAGVAAAYENAVTLRRRDGGTTRYAPFFYGRSG